MGFPNRWKAPEGQDQGGSDRPRQKMQQVLPAFRLYCAQGIPTYDLAYVYQTHIRSPYQLILRNFLPFECDHGLDGIFQALK